MKNQVKIRQQHIFDFYGNLLATVAVDSAGHVAVASLNPKDREVLSKSQKGLGNIGQSLKRIGLANSFTKLVTQTSVGIVDKIPNRHFQKADSKGRRRDTSLKHEVHQVVKNLQEWLAKSEQKSVNQ